MQSTDQDLTYIQSLINRVDEDVRGKLSDGYHTYDDLYAHRAALWKVLIKHLLISGINGIKVYKCLNHYDGTKYPGWFLSLVVLPSGEQLSYHLPMEEFKSTCGVSCKNSPVKFDGHSSKDVLKRLSLL